MMIGLLAGQPVRMPGVIAIVANASALHRFAFAMRKG
jgi:hypothetical protein